MPLASVSSYVMGLIWPGVCCNASSSSAYQRTTSAGGGGAGAVGGTAPNNDVAGQGGIGAICNILSSSNATTIACESGNYFKHTLTENTTFTFSNPPASGTGFSFVLHLIQDSSARTVTWPNSVDWASATAPTISTGNGDDDFYVFATSDGGTIWYGFTAGQAMA